MKKLFILTALAGFTFASCDQNKQSTTETETIQDTMTVVEEKEIEIETTTEVDTSDAEVVDTLNQQ